MGKNWDNPGIGTNKDMTEAGIREVHGVTSHTGQIVGRS